MRPPASIRRRLLAALTGLLLVVLVLGALTAYVVATRVASRAFDAGLFNSALALSKRVGFEGDRLVVDLPPDVQQLLSTDRFDRIFFQVRSARGEVLAGSPELLPPPAGPGEGGRLFYNSFAGGEPIRVVAYFVATERGSYLVQFAETLIKRARTVNEILLGIVIPVTVLGGVALALAWFGVGHALAPLRRLSEEIGTRSRRDLRPIAEPSAPEEVAPLVRSLNGLLAQLAEAMEAQRRFIANAAHQLRTPLAALQTQVELAAREADSGRRREILNQLEHAARRAGRLANQLLTLARAEPPGAAVGAGGQVVSLASLAGELAPVWVPRAAAARIDLGFDLEPAEVEGDRILLGELMGNLVDNALRYAPAGAIVTVRTATDAATARFEVQDSGSGIPAQERERVFERFYRVKGTPGDGVGLGLAIVREIAQRHGGTVAIEGAAGAFRVGVDFPATPSAGRHGAV